MKTSDNTLLEYHKRLLDLPEPWVVKSVNMDMEKREVVIEIEYPFQTFVDCPTCGEPAPEKDRRKRRWQHLAQMSFRTFIECNIPRCNCLDHGVHQITVPWAEPYGRFTMEFEAFAIEVLQKARSISDAADILNISWDKAQEIQKRAVDRGKKREKKQRIKHLGIDEKSFLTRHRYATVLTDIDRCRVIDVVQGREEDAAETVLSGLSEKQRAGVEAVAADFWQAYANAVETMLPNAELVHDRYHTTTYLTKAVDQVRKKEHKLLLRQGDESLTGTKYIWLSNRENWRKKQKAVYKELKSDALKVGRAFALKETFRKFWSYVYEGSALSFFKSWYFWATHCRLKPMIKVAGTFKRHEEGLFAYFRHRITNSASEGLNSTIQIIKAGARGFRNFQNYRTAILFHCGDLEMLPHNSR
jgi:transposase